MDRIKEVRAHLKISQIDLAKNAGVSQPFLSDLENNRRGAKPETYQRIADCMGVDVSEIVEKVG